MKTVAYTNHFGKNRKTFALRHILGTLACYLVILILGNLVVNWVSKDTSADVRISAPMVVNIFGKPLNGLPVTAPNAGTADVLFMTLGGVAFLLFTEKKVSPNRVNWTD